MKKRIFLILSILAFGLFFVPHVASAEGTGTPTQVTDNGVIYELSDPSIEKAYVVGFNSNDAGYDAETGFVIGNTVTSADVEYTVVSIGKTNGSVTCPESAFTVDATGATNLTAINDTTFLTNDKLTLIYKDADEKTHIYTNHIDYLLDTDTKTATITKFSATEVKINPTITYNIEDYTITTIATEVEFVDADGIPIEGTVHIDASGATNLTTVDESFFRNKILFDFTVKDDDNNDNILQYDGTTTKTWLIRSDMWAEMKTYWTCFNYEFKVAGVSEDYICTSGDRGLYTHWDDFLDSDRCLPAIFAHVDDMIWSNVSRIFFQFPDSTSHELFYGQNSWIMMSSEYASGIERIKDYPVILDGTSTVISYDCNLRPNLIHDFRDFTGTFNLPSEFGTSQGVTKVVALIKRSNVDYAIHGCIETYDYDAGCVTSVSYTATVLGAGSSGSANAATSLEIGDNIVQVTCLGSKTHAPDPVDGAFVLDLTSLGDLKNNESVSFVGEDTSKLISNLNGHSYIKYKYDGDAVKKYSAEGSCAEDHIHVNKIDPSCTSVGVTEHWYCPTTNAYYNSEECVEELSTSVVVAATDHNLKMVESNAASCTAEGNTLHYKCSVCNKLFSNADGTTGTTLEEVTLAKLGHDYKYERVDDSCHSVSCVRDGCNATLENEEHTFTCDESGEKFECSKCGYEKEITLAKTIILSRTTQDLVYAEDLSGGNGNGVADANITPNTPQTYTITDFDSDKYTLNLKFREKAFVHPADFRVSVNGQKQEFTKPTNGVYSFELPLDAGTNYINIEAAYNATSNGKFIPVVEGKAIMHGTYRK